MFNYKRRVRNSSMYFLAVCSSDGMFYDNYRLSLIEKILEIYIESGLSTSNYRDLLAGIGIEENECILLGMPVYYERKKDITQSIVDIACSDIDNNYYDTLINYVCSNRYYLESLEEFKQIILNDDKIGFLELNFFVSGFPEKLFKLLIDSKNKVVILYNDNAISFCEIDNNYKKKLKVAMKSVFGSTSMIPNKSYIENPMHIKRLRK